MEAPRIGQKIHLVSVDDDDVDALICELYRFAFNPIAAIAAKKMK